MAIDQFLLDVIGRTDSDCQSMGLFPFFLFSLYSVRLCRVRARFARARVI